MLILHVLQPHKFLAAWQEEASEAFDSLVMKCIKTKALCKKFTLTTIMLLQIYSAGYGKSEALQNEKVFLVFGLLK